MRPAAVGSLLLATLVPLAACEAPPPVSPPAPPSPTPASAPPPAPPPPPEVASAPGSSAPPPPPAPLASPARLERQSAGPIAIARFSSAAVARSAEGDVVLGEAGLAPLARSLTEGLQLGPTGETAVDPRPTKPRPVEKARELDGLLGRSHQEPWAITRKGFGEIAFYVSEAHRREAGAWRRLAATARMTLIEAATPWKPGTIVAFVAPSTLLPRVPPARLVAYGKPGVSAPRLSPAQGELARPDAPGVPPLCSARVRVRELLGFEGGELFALGEECSDRSRGLLVERFDARGKATLEPLPGASLPESMPVLLLRGPSPDAVCAGSNVGRGEGDDALVGPYVARFDGKAWAEISPPPTSGRRSLSALDCSARGDIWMIATGEKGEGELLRRSPQGTWSSVPLPSFEGATERMSAVDVIARKDGGAWVVARSNAPRDERGAILSLSP